MLQIRTVNKAVQEKFGEDIELVKDPAGYFYFKYDSDTFYGTIFETHTVSTYQLNNLSLESWLFEAGVLIEQVKLIYKNLQESKEWELKNIKREI